jgi:hypothetical protein
MPVVVTAQVCNTPPTASPDQADFSGGTVVVDVLANDADVDGEALEVFGLATTCPGSATEEFGVVTLAMSVIRLESDCTITYQVRDEAGFTATSTVTVRDATGIFSDSFESGDLSDWSEVS